MPAGRLNSLVKAKLIGNQSERYGSTFTSRYVSTPAHWLATLGCCSKDKSFVHGIPALPTELVGHPKAK